MDISWFMMQNNIPNNRNALSIATHIPETMNYNTVCFASSLSSDDTKLR